MTADGPGDFGRKLREARERKGVSLRDIASATKISVAALEALERNDISRLPGGIFSRAFVRSYAIEVGLDPDRTIQEFIAQFPEESVTAGHRLSERDVESAEGDGGTAPTTRRLVAISIPLALALVYFGTAGRRFTRHAPAVQPQAAAPAQSTPVAEPPVETVALADPKPPADTPAADQAATAAERLTVGLSVNRPCWVSAIVDGEKKIERLLQPGDSQTIDVARELVLTAGDASAVAMTLNGLEARPLGRSGEVVTRRVSLANFKDFLQNR